MPRVVRSQTIFLNSALRSQGESVCCWTITVPLALIRCAPEHHLRVQLTSFQVFMALETIGAANDTFVLKNEVTDTSTVVTLPHGTPRGRDLAASIQTAYPDCACAFDVTNNKLNFSFADAHTIYFGTSKAWRLLGFAEDETPTGATIASSAAIDLAPVRDLQVRLEGVSPMGSTNLECVAGGEVRASNLLLSIPVANLEPFTNITYTAQSEGVFALDLIDRSINTLRLRLVDADGNSLPLRKDYTATLRLDVVSPLDEAVERLGALKSSVDKLIDLIRLTTLGRYILSGKNK